MDNTKTAEDILNERVLHRFVTTNFPDATKANVLLAMEEYASPLKKRIEELEHFLRLAQTQIEFLNDSYCQGQSESSANAVKRIEQLLNPSTNGKQN